MAESRSSFPPFAPSPTDERYDVGEFIAAGGMGSVYRAFDKLGQRAIAYKRMRLSDDSSGARRAALFQGEFDTLRRLSHPNIVEAYDFGFDTQGPFYTMELLSDADLSKLSRLPFREACRLLRDVASALALLHARRLVHRDVSPRNVCMSRGGQAKLIDFGALTRFGTPREIVGTPAFIAPECLTDAPLDQRTDLYSLGALSYWLLTGHTHVRANAIDDLADAWQEPLLAPSRRVAELPRELDALVLSLLRAEPGGRPASAADVIEQLTTIAQLAPEQDAERVAYSYLQHPPLVGREPIVERLVRALGHAVAGTGQIVLLEAEPGLGRSALLDQVTVEAQMAGATVVRARGGLHSAPFSAAHELVRAGLGMQPAVARSLRERASLFVRMLGSGEGTSALVRSTIDAAEQRAAHTALLHDALTALAARAPLVMLVDDAHVVDAGSLALLASMTEAIRSQRILLVLSAHTEQPLAGGAEAPDVQKSQARARLASSAERLLLLPLSETELAQLVSTTFGGVPNCQSLAAWLFAQAGGNPAHCMELARLLLAQGAVRYLLGTFTLPYEHASRVAPQNHGEVLRSRLERLNVDAREHAALLALHSGPLSTEELASARGGSASETLLALHELVQHGAALSYGERFCCASEALRTMIVGTLPVERCAALHLTLARAVAKHDSGTLDDVFAAAEHLLQAGEAEQLEGAYLLARAAEQHKFELGTRPKTLALLEAGLAILQRVGLSDKDCIGLLVPLSLAGFYGDIAMQRRYLDRTLAALASICGLTRARWLKRWVGGPLALLLGVGLAFALHLVRRSALTRRSFVAHLECLTGVTGPATAAAACSFDAPEAWRVVAWLEPLAAAPKRNPLFFMREFCVATAELVSARFESAAQRYADLRAVYATRVPGIDAHHAIQIRCGCLNGLAQALVADTSPETLVLAEELQNGGGGAFFAPHAEGVRAAYHGYRGETQLVQLHRERAETLSLQAGTCWSAMSVLTVRLVLPAALCGDVIALVRLVADLEQLSSLSASLCALHQLAQAHLSSLRGERVLALQLYERAFASEVARQLPTFAVERALHAEALSATGDHAGARALCLALLDELQDERQANDLLYCIPRQKLALAEAGLGQLSQAAGRLDACLQRDGAHGNPLQRGLLHRDRAHVAALADDRVNFEHHLALAVGHFRASENPWLMRQGELLREFGRRLGRGAVEPLLDAGPGDDLDGQTAVERPLREATTLAERASHVSAPARR